MDLAAATGARATLMSLLWAGRSSWCSSAWRTRAGATPHHGIDDYVTAGSWLARQSRAQLHRTRSCHMPGPGQSMWHVHAYCFDKPLLFVTRGRPCNGMGQKV